MTVNIHVRGVDEKIVDQLKQLATEQRSSLNKVILAILRQGLGLSKRKTPKIYHDLDELAGTWTKRQAEEFNKAIAPFEKIDEELWK